MSISISERDGLLTSSLDEPGWLPDLPPDERTTLARALEGMYNLAGVDWIAETGAPPEPIKWKDWVRDWQPQEGNNGQQTAGTVGWAESSRPTDQPQTEGRATPVGLEDSTHPT
jgi:hypothetical protein